MPRSSSTAAVDGARSTRKRPPRSAASRPSQSRKDRDATNGASKANGGGPEHIRVRLFDADRRDEMLTWADIFERSPNERQLLWIDIEGDLSEADARRLAGHLGLRPRTRDALLRHVTEPMIALHRGYLHVRVASEPSDKDPGATIWLDLIAAQNVTISQHRDPIGFLDDMDQRIERDSDIGILNSTAFLGAILDGAITSYHRAVDSVEEDVDRMDAASLRGSRDDLLRELVMLRRRIARLRRLLADHRAVFAALGSPELGSFVGDPDIATVLNAVSARYDGAMGAVEDSREALLGSFDVFMSRTAQRTNEVMKVLTLTTVLLLPGSMIAGLLGMNVVVPLGKDDPLSFWFVVGAIVVLAVAIVAIARVRKWL